MDTDRFVINIFIVKIKKAEGIKRCVIKCTLMFENYKESFFNNKTILKSQLRFKRCHHNVYTEEVNKIALNSNMMIRDCKHLIELQHIHMEQMLLKYVKVKCYEKYVATYK